MIDVFADRLGSHQSRLDASVSDRLRGQGAEQGLALIGGLGQLFEALAVAHHGQLRRRSDAFRAERNGLSDKGAAASDCDDNNNNINNNEGSSV